MAAGKHNFTIEQGVTWNPTITVADSGTARNLTGYTIRMHVRKEYNSSEAYLDLDTDDGITITNAAGGEFEILRTAVQTAALTPVTNYVYDLELVDGSSVVTRLIQGNFTVLPEVTK